MSQALPESAIDRLLDPVSRCLTGESARALAELRLDPQLQERLDLLADRSSAGELTPDEREEYEESVRTLHVIGILQAKVRSSLAKAAA